eukprot:GHUV01008801.1.p1 GENE.GHUV01008801.1~~GHUV01008801.1.p1  ORF type:complete len:575 (+),score=160.71 GHUV01008801.1:1377-3101(+)
MNDDSHHPQQAVRAHHDGQMTFMVDSLARKVPLVIGAIVVLLVVNITLQYAAGPALNHALPLQDARGTVRIDGDQHTVQHGPDHDLTHDVAPGGADAELLCVDKELGCDKQSCSKESVRYHACKSSCDACDQLKALIQADTGLQVRVVQQLSRCVDLHPSCDAWVKADKCSRESKSMLELCQASCGFCLPPSVSPLAAGSSKSSKDPSSSGSSSQTAATSSSITDDTAVLLDSCQDDMNVCPYLAFTGMCSSGSLWITTQCARSCRVCQPSQHTQLLAAGDNIVVATQRTDLNQQLIEGTSTTDSTSNAADTSSSTASSSSAAETPAGSPSAAEVLAQPVFGTPNISGHKLYGSHEPTGSFSSQALQEWQIKDCHDYVDRCPVWANDGECSKNLDYMMISCKQSCNNCKIYSTNKPFRVAQLNSGYKMPTVGFGTAGLTVGTAAAVQFAVAAGYRMFDSAESPDWYDEAQVGAGLAASKVPRDQLFLMSKIHPRDFGHAATLAAVKRSLGHYNTSYLDMLLLHYPSCTPGTQCVPQPERTWQQSWKTLEELVNAQLVRSIGTRSRGSGHSFGIC